MRAEGKTLLVLAGPTASGKSALALALARRLGGTVINADAMQCYRELRVITARPSLEDEAMAPHRLYGVRRAAEPANAAWWREAALAEISACDVPILCGGTGMYFSCADQWHRRNSRSRDRSQGAGAAVGGGAWRAGFACKAGCGDGGEVETG